MNLVQLYSISWLYTSIRCTKHQGIQNSIGNGKHKHAVMFEIWRMDSSNTYVSEYIVRVMDNGCIIVVVLVETIPHPSRTNFGLRLVYRVGLGLGLVFIFV